MKKFIVLSALAAVASTAFVACSSDDDLAQAPAVPEENVVDTPKGAPFSVVAFNTDDTRAVRYNANGEGVKPDGTAATGDDAFVKSFKLYGMQADASDAWINNLIFARTAKTGDDSKFEPKRYNNGEDFAGTLTWPDGSATKTSTFYAITDNAIATGDGNTINNVTWNPASGTFTYTVPTTTETVKYFDFDDTYELLSTSKTNVVNADALRDLMVATASKTAAENPENSVSLNFDHVLSSLAINAWFVSGQSNTVVPANVDICAVMVCGLKGYSTYTLSGSTPGFAAPTTDVIYYKEFSSVIHTSKEPVAKWSNPTLYPLVAPGEWLVIPQTCTPWNRYLSDDNLFPVIDWEWSLEKWNKDISEGRQRDMSGAFISLLIYVPSTDSYTLLSFPLTTNTAHKADVTNSSLSDLANVTFNPGKTRTININIALGREHYLATTPAYIAQFAWEPGTFEIN